MSDCRPQWAVRKRRSMSGSEEFLGEMARRGGAEKVCAVPSSGWMSFGLGLVSVLCLSLTTLRSLIAGTALGQRSSRSVVRKFDLGLKPLVRHGSILNEWGGTHVCDSLHWRAVFVSYLRVKSRIDSSRLSWYCVS